MPWLIPVGIAAAGATSVGMAAESAGQQQRAADEANKKQQELFDAMIAESKRAGERARAEAVAGTKEAEARYASAMSLAQKYGGQVQDYLAAGYGGARQDMLAGLGGAEQRAAEGMGMARGDILGGLSGAESALEGGLGAAGGTLRGLMAGAGYDPYDVTRQRSRLAELYDQPFDFQADPGYQFRLQQGEQAINRAASQRGGRLSGRTLEALQEYGQGLASQEYEKAYQRKLAGAQAADISQQQLALNQAGRSDAAAQFAAQQQAGLGGQLAAMQYGAGGQLAGLRTGAAGQLGQMGYGLGQLLGQWQLGTGQGLAGLGTNLAGLQAQYGYGLGGQMVGLGQQMAGLYGQQGQQLTAQQYQNYLNQAAMAQNKAAGYAAPVQYAGGGMAAGLNQINTLASGLGQVAAQGSGAMMKAFGV